ncbi:hypothetical protein [Mycolicibacterium sp. HS_4_1]
MSDRDDSQDEGVQDSQSEVVRDLYPKEFAQLAIGVPINADMNKVMLLTRAFDGGKLANSGLFVDPKPSTYGRLELRAGATDSKTQDTSGWNASASMKLNLGIADFSAKFYVQQEHNACKRSAKAVLVGHSFKKCELVLQDTASPQQWYNCTTEDFRNKFGAVSRAALAAACSGGVNAADLQALGRALGDFYKTYGTGFVCGLQLIAYGMVEGSWEREDTSTKDDFTIGGGIAASLPFVGFGAAGEYVKTQAADTVKTMLTVRALGRPESSPQFQWAAAKAEALDGHSLEEFLNGEAWSQDAAKKVSDPENPKLEYDAIDITQFVIPELPGGLGALSKAIKALQAITVNRVNGAQPIPQTGEEDPEASAVNAKVAALKSVAAFTEDKINDVAFGRTHIDQSAEPDAKSVAPQYNTLRADDGATHGGDSRVTELNLGDYVPCGYYYRSWEDVFPELRLALECTPAQVVFGQSLVWYSMREMFAQYLEFCADFRGVSRQRNGTSLDIATRASAFRAALDEVGEYLSDELMKETAKSDLNFVQELERTLKRKLGAHNFDMYKHYEFWMANYDWLKLAPFGVVAVIDRDGELHYQQSPYPGNPMVRSTQPDGCAPVPSCMPADLLVANAYRLYPIISTSATGEPHFVWVGAASPLKGDNDDASLRYSGRFALNRSDPAETPAAMSRSWERKRLPTDPPWQATGPFHVVPDDVVLNEVALPMLIHQSKDAAEEILRAEKDLDWDCLVERWTNRKRVFGMHLYAGVGDDDGFGHSFTGDGQEIDGVKPVERLREIAGRLAQAATAHAQVLPQLPTKDQQEDSPPIWGLQEPAGVVGAYFAERDATFFWGPAAGSGWDLRQPGSDKHLFAPCPVKFIPIDYGDVSDALKSIGEDFEHFDHKTAPAWATAGGGAMWRRPRARLMQRLKALSGQSEEGPADPA